MASSKLSGGWFVSFLILALCASGPPPSEARPYVLLADGTGDFPTIQTAVDAAADHDVIVLQDGVYMGEGNRDIVFGGKAVTVTSARGPSACIIDCGGLGQGFLFDFLDGAGTIVNGITIRGASGYGISCSIPGGGPTLIGCVVEDCANGILLGGGSTVIDCVSRSNAGIGISQTVGGGSAVMIGCVSEANGGVGVRCASIGTLIGCEIRGNRRVGVAVSDAFPWIVSSVIAGNADRYGGGLFVDDGHCHLWNSTVSGNLASTDGGGLYIGEMGNVHMRDSAVWGNHAGEAGDEAWVQPGGDLDIVCSDVDTSGVHGSYVLLDTCVFSDPLFCDPVSWEEAPTTEGDYAVAASSPCLPESSPCGRPIGALGEGCPSPPASVHPPEQGSPLWIMSLRPNPATREVEFAVDVPPGCPLRLEVVDTSGRVLARLPSGEGSGPRAVTWDGRLLGGSPAPAGVYFLRVIGIGMEEARRFVVVH